jgi:TPR repeat protein
MTSIYVDVVETGAADSGHTAIRISGLSSLPADPTFRIDPIDEALTDTSDVDWPAGPRRPQAVVAHDGAFDLVLGPDVLESPLLLPGTPVVISVTDTAIVKELIWPSIPTRKRRKRRPVIVTEALREAERRTHEAKRVSETAAASTASMLAKAEATAAAGAAAAAFGGAGSFRPNGLDRARRSVEAPSVTVDADTTGNGLSGFNRSKVGNGSAAGDTTSAAERLTEPARLVPKVEGAATPSAGLPAKGQSTALAPMPTAPARPVGVGRQVGAFFGGMAAAALMVLGLVQMRLLQWQPATAATVSMPDAALSAARNASTLRAILATSGISPRGKPAVGVDGQQALALADTYLHGSANAPRDQGEASFWLRHALTQAIDQDGMRWALTQLGSIFAAPEGFEPDFTKARMLWEVAGGLGDPVALCFNASLYEHGLGVPKHKDLARALYERARSAGGCSGNDDAISRTK